MHSIRMFSLWWLEAFSSYFLAVMILLSVYFFFVLFCLQQACMVLNFCVACELKSCSILNMCKNNLEAFKSFNYVSGFVCLD